MNDWTIFKVVIKYDKIEQFGDSTGLCGEKERAQTDTNRICTRMSPIE